MKKSTVLIILISLIALLAALLILIKTGVVGSKTKDVQDDDAIGTDEHEEKDEYIKIKSIDPDTVETFSLDLSGEMLSFIKKDGKWIYKEDESAELDQDAVGAMVNSLENILAYRIICEDCPDLSEYGIDSEKNKITLTLSSGDKRSYLFGDYSKLSEAYYFAVDSENTVYFLVDKITPFCQKSIGDLTVKEES